MNRRLRAVALTFAALLASASSVALGAAPSTQSVLPFIEDDYGKALALAKQKKVPIFAEAWAPW